MQSTWKTSLWVAIVAIGLIASACAGDDPADDGDAIGVPDTTTPGNVVRPIVPTQQQAELDRLLAEVEQAQRLTLEEFRERNHIPHQPAPLVDTNDVAGMDLIQGSSFALDPTEMTRLQDDGFVITGRLEYPTFTYGYDTLYMEDLPLFVSADSILFAVHKSYDDILQAIEVEVLIAELDAMLETMRGNLQAGDAAAFGAVAEADLDFYLAVTLSLLRDMPQAPVRGADAAAIDEFVQQAKAAEGWTSTDLFGVARDMDFSQFTPRGHYTDTPQLEQYFRAMMWLGRIDFRLVETQPDHSQVFHRRQFDAVMGMYALVDSDVQTRWSLVDDTVRTFVGESDNMTLTQVTSLLDDLGLENAAAASDVPDDRIAQAILDGGYGHQEISSHIMINGVGEATMPLSSTFLLFGQRYVVDSHVFSNVVYDRVNNGNTMRMMPDPLDVAYAALANDQAGALLDEELQKYHYQGDLEAMRVLVDAHGDTFWDANLYNLWLGALRQLSPNAEEIASAQSGLPAVARTERWGRRVLNTQLASWAELRHDTILYAKQSYTGGATCEFPDAYVDPYPAFYAALGKFALQGEGLIERLDLDTESYTAQRLEGFFTTLASTSATLQEMAEYQRRGEPFTAAHMEFINQTVRIQWGCGDPAGAEGWYAQLFFNPTSATDFDPTIADVHTQPTDEGGAPVGRVLHVGTGMPRAMVVTVDTCTGPRAYVGLTSSYFEEITEDFDRLDDIRWSQQLQQATPSDVSWMQDVVVR